MCKVVIVGSAFDSLRLGGRSLLPETVDTSRGSVTVHRWQGAEEAYVLFRHGVPHRYLPNQIPYRAHTEALRKLGCESLLITSSCGVLDLSIPLDRPLLVSDLLMLENRLPDGTACSMFDEPTERQGHLVIDGGLFDAELSMQVEAFGADLEWDSAPRVVFGYAGGPRTKTPAENRALANMGAQVNSMTLGPEVVLANEYQIPTAAVVVGHKYSVPDADGPLDKRSLAGSLVRSKAAMEALVGVFLLDAEPVEFKNRIYRFDQ